MIADVDRMSLHFVRQFREGRLGLLNLDWEDVEMLNQRNWHKRKSAAVEDEDVVGQQGEEEEERR